MKMAFTRCRYITAIWLVIQLVNLSGAEFCFKRIHGPQPSDPSVTVCRGLLGKQTFPSIRACCDLENAMAYHSQLIPLGKRKKKWQCIPCPAESDVTQDLFVAVEGAGWSSWGNWSTCSVTCSFGERTRQRICQDTIPSNCEGAAVMKKICVEKVDCPVDGSWGPWSSWTDCSKSCSGGIIERSRRCNHPAPAHGGKECEGNNTHIESCNIQGCPVDGGWSNWTSNNTCSVTCGKGKLTSLRFCNNPTPQNGGKDCSGASRSIEKCDTDVNCPIHGGWSLWSRFTSCSGTCGKGTRQRFRACAAPKPRYGGKPCDGETLDSQDCYSYNPCPVNGGWSPWGTWGACLAKPCSNSTGLQIRSRTCSNPLPRFRGNMCEGFTTETQPCYFNENCPVNGAWCDWQPYSECRKSESNINFRIRVRECNCPVPDNGGNTCRGDDYETDSCMLDTDVNNHNARSARCKDREVVWEGSGNGDDEDEHC